MTLLHRLPESVRIVLLKKVERAADLPRSVRKTMAALTFLIVAVLFISGGTLAGASFMHVIVTKLDLPPSVQSPFILTSADQVVHIESNQGKPQTYIVVPRPSPAHALNHFIETVHDPTASFIQMDAVDAGLFLQETVHDWLLGLFAKATRSPGPPSQAAVPLLDGQ